MEFLGLVIFIIIIAKLLIWILPISIFTSSSGFWTGFWVYIWSTSGFKKLIKVLVLGFSFLFVLFFFKMILKS